MGKFTHEPKYWIFSTKFKQDCKERTSGLKKSVIEQSSCQCSMTLIWKGKITKILVLAGYMADTMTNTAHLFLSNSLLQHLTSPTQPDPVIGHATLALVDVYTTPAPVIEIVAPGPAVTYAASVLVFEYVSPAPLIDYIAPASAVTYVVPNQQLPPENTTTTVTTDDNLDMTGFVITQFSSTAVEPFPSHVVGPLPPLEEFIEPVFSHVHQKQIAAGEMTENIAEIGDSLAEPIVEETIDVLPRSITAVDEAPAHVDEFIAEVPVATFMNFARSSLQNRLNSVKLNLRFNGSSFSRQYLDELAMRASFPRPSKLTILVK